MLSAISSPERRNKVLRITFQEKPGAMSMKLEGRIAGQGTAEFERAWNTVEPSLGSRRVLVDLCGVTFLDAGGRQLLRNIYQKTGAEFLADTPLTKYFAEEAQSADGTTHDGRGKPTS
jgi:hypothetical protein